MPKILYFFILILVLAGIWKVCSESGKLALLLHAWVDADPRPELGNDGFKTDRKKISFQRKRVERQQSGPEVSGKYHVPANLGEGSAPQLGEEGRHLKLTAEDRRIISMVRVRFASGDYQTCLLMIQEYLEDARTSAEVRRWLKSQIKSVLISLGWLLLKTGACERAVQYLLEAAAHGPDSRISSGLAHCYHHMRDFDRAREHIDRYLEQQPRDIWATILKADILESILDFDRSVHTLEKALSLTEGSLKESIRQRLRSLRYKREASQNQMVWESPHFRILFPEDVRPEMIGQLVDILEQSHEELVFRYQFRKLRSQVEVNIYPGKMFDSVMAHGPGWVAGVFDGRIGIPLPDTSSEGRFWSDLRGVLRHELVHAVLHEMSGRRSLPPWFDEGMAQHFACSGANCDVSRQHLESSGFFARESFESSFMSLGEAEAVKIYHQSLYLIQYLEFLNPDNLRLIANAIRTRGSLSSDNLLIPLEMDFNSLLANASVLWNQRYSFVKDSR